VWILVEWGREKARFNGRKLDYTVEWGREKARFNGRIGI
jgi:hypothetical protein